MDEFNMLSIVSHSYPTLDSVRINLNVPKELKQYFKFKPGQYITLKIKLDETYHYRDYSLCSAPDEGNLSILIKKAKEGTISHYLYDYINDLSTLEVSFPKGNFVIPERPNEKRTLVFFATGSGITPIISIIKHTLKTEKGVSIYLFYGNKSQEKTIFYDEIEELNNQYPKNLYPYFLYTEQKCDPLFQGRITEKKLKLFINQLLDWDEVDEVMVCGQPEMIKEIVLATLNLGIPIKNIHYEFFQHHNLQDFYNKISSQHKEIEEVEVDFMFKGEQNKIIWKTLESSLLDAFLDRGYQIPYSCKGGVCTQCACKIVKGNLGMIENSILTESEIKSNYRLICVATPISKKISLNFDKTL
ncbi:MAG: 2Fe-2S iron-sulfur cluster binding domain-containing protein [Flavobacteriales bacterium]|nr:2Fe-2S iron-sulfur cluster binding domain-containing protein [Flavobacteriales bacterium]